MSKIAIVGCDGSGKTVLISALSDYYKAGTRPGQTCIMVPSDTNTRRYTDNLHRIMRVDRKWPQATNDIVGGGTLKWVLMHGEEKLADLELMDFGGENFRYAFRDDGEVKNPQVVAQLKAYIEGADFVVVTVGLDKMLRNLDPAVYRKLERGDVEYDRDSEAQWITNGLMKLVESKLKSDPVGVVIALTQADKHREALAESGARGLFAKCWPMIATIYPKVPVVAVASVDRMADDGCPADGYRTDGVLAVMEAFARYRFGDPESELARFENARAALGTIDAEKSPDDFLSALENCREVLSRLRKSSAMIAGRCEQELSAGEKFLEGLAVAEEKARHEAETRRHEAERAALEERQRELERLQTEREEKVGAPSPKEDAHGAAGITTGLIVLGLVGALAYGGWRTWRFVEERRAEADSRSAASAREAREAEQAKAEADRKLAEAQQAAAEERRCQEAAQLAAERKLAEAQQAAEAELRRHEAEQLAAKREAERKLKEAEEKAEAERQRQEAARIAAERKLEEELKATEARERQRVESERKQEEERKRLAAEQQRQREEAERKLEEERKRAEAAEAEKKAAEKKLKEAENARKEAEKKLKDAEDADAVEEQTAESVFNEKLAAAEKGDVAAMLWVGNCYYSAPADSGVKSDPVAACRWYKRAADLKSPEACYNLSILLESGDGCQRDDARSGRYCLQAARLGHVESMFWTGMYFLKGSHGFEKSPATAYKYLTLAKNGGYRDPDLADALAEAELEKDGEVVDGRYPENPEEAPKKRRSLLDLLW